MAQVGGPDRVTIQSHAASAATEEDPGLKSVVDDAGPGQGPERGGEEGRDLGPRSAGGGPDPGTEDNAGLQ